MVGLSLSDMFAPEQPIQSIECKTQVLQFYGLQGIPEAVKLSSSAQLASTRNCPTIKHSCCSEEDFTTTQSLWKTNLHNIKGYLTKVIRIIQKILMTQTALIDIAHQHDQDDFDQCQAVDITFFNPPVGFTEIHMYLQAAYKSMAFLQKGFYCSICDAENHRFLMLKGDGPSREVRVSRKSCNDLIYYFKEFIMFKTYYFDAFALNMTRLRNCINRSDEPLFSPDYGVSYQEFKSCIEHDRNCEVVCNQFRVGGASRLFLGNLFQYENILDDMAQIFQRHKVDVLDVPSQIVVPDYKVKYFEFFRQPEQLSDFHKDELKPWRFYLTKTVTADDGLDLFGTAQNSNYFLTDQYTSIEKNRIFDNSPGNGGNDSLLSSGQFHSEQEQKRRQEPVGTVAKKSKQGQNELEDQLAQAQEETNLSEFDQIKSHLTNALEFVTSFVSKLSFLKLIILGLVFVY